MRIALICLLLFSLILTVDAQTVQCTRNLNDAEEAFDQGRLEDVLRILNKDNGTAKDCYNNFTQDEIIRAEKLLTKAYIFTDNPAAAEKSLLDLLKEDKEHQLAKDDPAELHHLYDQYKTEPIFRVGLRLGVNKSLPIIIQEFNSLTYDGSSKKYNEDGATTGLGIGVSLEALAERHLAKGIEVGLGLQYRIANYEVEGDIFSEAGALIYKIKNQSSMIRVPLLFRYSFNYDKKDANGLRITKLPYFFLGGSFDYVSQAKYVNTDRTGGTAFTLNENQELIAVGPDRVNQVARTNASVFAGIGLKMRMGREQVNFLTFELRYDNALFNYINPDHRYANEDVNYDIGHVEDDLALNMITFSIGYTHSFYKPTKRKQYR